MKKLEKYFDKYIILLIIVLSLPAVSALFVPGYFGASDDIHIAWLHQMHRSLISGQIPPRYVPDLSFRFGYPLFNFVFPLPFYLAEIFNLFGLSLVDSIKAVFVLSIPLSVYFMYLLAKELSNKFVALAAGVLYAYTPYRATDLYVRGAIGEILSFVFLPLIILSIIKVFKDERRWIGVGAIAIAGLILTHNIAAYMFIPTSILLIIILIFVNNDIYTIKNYLIMYLFGFFISIYFWLPAILDSRLMKFDTVFNFYDHFPTIKQLITPYFGYGASVPGPYDGMSFFVGLFNLLAVAFGILILVLKWKKMDKFVKSLFVWMISVFMISIFMMNHRSALVWENVPLIQYFQFPWRFLMLTTFLSPLFLITLSYFSKRLILSVVLIALIIFSTFRYFHPQDYLGRTDEYYLNRYIPYPDASTEYLETSEEYLRLTKHTSQRPSSVLPEIYGEGVEVIELIEINPLKFEANINVNQVTNVNLRKYYFPGWNVYINNKKAEIFPGEPHGQVSFNVDKGRYNISYYFTETKSKLFLDLTSIAAFIIVGCYIFNLKIDNARNIKK